MGEIIFFCRRERLREASRVKREAAKYASRDTNWSFEEVRCLIVKERNSSGPPPRLASRDGEAGKAGGGCVLRSAYCVRLRLGASPRRVVRPIIAICKGESHPSGTTKGDDRRPSIYGSNLRD